MKEMIMWDKYDNKYREVVDVEVARGLEADLYEANNRIVDFMDIIEERDRIIDLMITWISENENPFDDCYEYSISCADIDCKDCIRKYFEERCKNAKD